MRLTFNLNYFLLAFLIFWIEVAIAVFVHDDFIRPYLGDVLVVILMYCFVKSFWNWPVAPTALSVLCIAFTVEASQHLNFLETLGLQHSRLAQTVLGTSFSCADLLTYVIGVALVIGVEKFSKKTTPKTQ